MKKLSLLLREGGCLWLALWMLSAGYHSAMGQTNGSSEPYVPNRDIVVKDNTITVTYYLPEFQQISAFSDSTKTYHGVPGFGFCTESGRPMLPMRFDTFKVPEGYTVKVSTSIMNQQFVKCNYAGALLPLIDSSEESPTHSEILPYAGYFPEKIADIHEVYNLRDENLAEIALSPVQYDQSSGIAILNKQFSYTLTFVPEEEVTAAMAESMTVAVSDNSLTSQLMDSYVSNINTVGGVDKLDTDGYNGSIGYLIVTTDKYLTSIDGFVRWKKLLGYNVYVRSKSEWSSPEEVRTSIFNIRRKNGDIKYLLIVGDHEDVPAMAYDGLLTCQDEYYSDMQYASFRVINPVPDIYMGRVPVNTTLEADHTLNKLIRLEMCPIQDPIYYSNVVNAAKYDIAEYVNVEDRDFIRTSEEIKNYISRQGVMVHRFYAADNDAWPYYYRGSQSILPQELWKPAYNWVVNPKAIMDRINEGALYALYRGHGSPTSWAGVGLSTRHFSDLHNYELYPLVLSITCQTGKFTETCFAEEMLKLSDAGAYAVFAASENSLSYYNDVLAEGIIDAIWPTPGMFKDFAPTNPNSIMQYTLPTYRLGQILEQGLFRMRQIYGTGTWSDYQRNIYHIFGDPSMYVHTQNPAPFENIEIQRRSGGIYVNTHGDRGSISFYNPSQDKGAKYELSSVYYPTDDPNNTVVCITGHNRLTYLDGITTPIIVEEDMPALPKLSKCVLNDSMAATISIENDGINGNLQLNVSDITGRLLSNQQVECTDLRMEVSAWLPSTKGVYVISLVKDGQIIDTKKIIKNR